METLYGESPEYLYEDQGGIAVMSNDITEGTVSGGSGGDTSGVVGVPTRILWTISYDGTRYSGGITGVAPFQYEYTYSIMDDSVTTTGPFLMPSLSDQDVLAVLYAHALANENRLDSYFTSWNSNPENVQDFITYLRHSSASNCVIEGTSSN